MHLTKRDDFFSDLLNWEPSNIFLGGYPKMLVPRVDIEETPKEVLIKADIPGYDPKKVDIEVSAHSVTLSSEEREEDEKKDRQFYRHERVVRSFTRTIELPAEVYTEDVKAQSKNGTLTITLPKKEPTQSEARHVPVEEG